MRPSSTALLAFLVGCNPLLDLDGYGYVDPTSGDGGSSSSNGGGGAAAGGAGGAPSTGGSGGTAGGGGESCLETGDPDLLAYYPLDEASGMTASDCSGNGHDGTVVSAMPAGSWGAGHFAGGFSSDGNSGCIDLGVPAELVVEGGSFTAAAWAAASTFATGGGMSRYIFGRSAETDLAGWRFGADNVSRWGSKFRDTAAPILVQGPNGETPDTWRHVAIVFDAGTARLYVDGAMVGSQAYTAIVPDNGSTLRIGCRGDDNYHFDGTIDEVRLYGRAFDDTEVAALAALVK